MRRLSDRDAMTEARRFKTLTLSRATAGDVAIPQPTAQNQMLIANATPVWALLAAPTAEFQVPIAGADPYTPVWSALTVGAISDLAYATPGLTLSTANAEGSADTVIRTDATIAIFDATVPDIIQPDDAAATGSAAIAARRDHTHGIVCAAPASPSVSLAASAEGSGTSFARADHAHQLDQAIVPTWTEIHTHAANVVLDDGASDSPQLQFVGGSNDDTALMFLADDATGGDSDLVIRLCAADTGSQLIIQDSSPATVVYIDADGNADFIGHMAIGSAASIDVNRVLKLDETSTITTGYAYGLFDRLIVNPGANWTSSFYGFSLVARVDSNFTQTAGAIIGGQSVVNVLGGRTPTLPLVIGNLIQMDMEDATSVAVANLLQLKMPKIDTGAITDSYGIRIHDATVGTGSITNQYGIYIYNLNQAATLNCAIYTNIGLVHFGDQVEIVGSAAADVQLTVRGCAAQSASLQEWQNSTPVTLLSVPAAGGLTFSAASAANIVTVPDNLAQAMHVVDAGGIEYLSIVSTNTQPAVVFNQGAIDVDFRVEASGVSYALFVRGSDHYIGANVENPLAPFHIHGRVLLNTGLAFSGTVPTSYIEIPDNAAIALRLLDAGALEYLRIISTDAQSVVVFNEGGADVDHRWEAVGQTHALFVQGSDGFIALGHSDPTRMLHIASDAVNTANIILQEHSSIAASAPDVFQRRARGTIASPLDVAVNDGLGVLYFVGYRNSDWRQAAMIASTVTSLGASVVRAKLSLRTANAAGTLIEHLVVDEDGNTGLGTVPGTRLHVVSTDNFSLTTNTDDTLLLKSADNAAAGGHGASIGFVRSVGGANRQAAIAIVHGGPALDADNQGLAFFTHPGDGNDSTIVEQMRIQYDGEIRVASLAGVGVRAVVADADGNLSAP